MSKKCQNCGAEMADNMNFCPQCHAKYEAPDAAGNPPAAGVGCSPAELDQILQHLLKQLSNQSFKYSVVKTGENRYGLKLETPMVNAGSDIVIENHAGSLSASLANLKSSPSAMGWFLLIAGCCFTVPFYFLLFDPITKKNIGGVIHSLNGAIRHPHAFRLPDQPDFDARGKTPEEIARMCFTSREFPNGVRATFAGSLDMSLVNSAVANYAQGVTADNIICLLDTTPAGSPVGSYGVVFTLDKICFRFRMLKISVSNKLGYRDISGGLLANCSIKGSTFKYNSVLTAADNRNNIFLGSFPGDPNGDIPEPVLCFQEKLLHLVRTMQSRG